MSCPERNVAQKNTASGNVIADKVIVLKKLEARCNANISTITTNIISSRIGDIVMKTPNGKVIIENELDASIKPNLPIFVNVTPLTVESNTKDSTLIMADGWCRMDSSILGETANDRDGIDGTIAMSDSGLTLAISSYFHDSRRGHVRIFDMIGNVWTQRGDNINGPQSNIDFGVGIDISADGNTVIIGANGYDEVLLNRGLIQVYEWDGVDWVQKGQNLLGSAAQDTLGNGAAINDDATTIAIGAIRNDAGGNDSGQVRVYDWNGTIWVQRGAAILGSMAGENFGLGLVLNGDGNRFVSAGRFNDTGGTNTGAVRVYEWDGVAWVQLGSDIYGEPSSQSGFYLDMDKSGDIIVIGGNGSHIVRVYMWNGINWVQRGNDLPRFANSAVTVSITGDGNRLIVGDPFETNGPFATAGSIRVYNWNGIDWDQYGGVIYGDIANIRFGSAVAINNDGTLIASSAPFSNINGTTYTYSVDPPIEIILPDPAIACGKKIWFRNCRRNIFSTTSNVISAPDAAPSNNIMISTDTSCLIQSDGVANWYQIQLI